VQVSELRKVRKVRVDVKQRQMNFPFSFFFFLSLFRVASTRGRPQKRLSFFLSGSQRWRGGGGEGDPQKPPRPRCELGQKKGTNLNLELAITAPYSDYYCCCIFSLLPRLLLQHAG